MRDFISSIRGKCIMKEFLSFLFEYSVGAFVLGWHIVQNKSQGDLDGI